MEVAIVCIHTRKRTRTHIHSHTHVRMQVGMYIQTEIACTYCFHAWTGTLLRCYVISVKGTSSAHSAMCLVALYVH